MSACTKAFPCRYLQQKISFKPNYYKYFCLFWTDWHGFLLIEFSGLTTCTWLLTDPSYSYSYLYQALELFASNIRAPASQHITTCMHYIHTLRDTQLSGLMFNTCRQTDNTNPLLYNTTGNSVFQHYNKHTETCPPGAPTQCSLPTMR